MMHPPHLLYVVSMSLVRKKSVIFEPETGIYVASARSSLLTNHGMISFRCKRDPVVDAIATEGRNFALIVFQILAPVLKQFRVDFHAMAGSSPRVRLNCAQFITLTTHYVLRRYDKTIPPLSEAKVYSAMSTRLADISLEGLRVDAFGNHEQFDQLVERDDELPKHLGRLFRAVDFDGSGFITWEALFTFVSDAVVRGPVTQKELRRHFALDVQSTHFSVGRVESVRATAGYHIVHATKPHPVIKNVNDAVLQVFDDQAQCRGAPHAEFQIPFHPYHLLDYTYLRHLGALFLSTSDMKFRIARVNLSSGTMAHDFQELGCDNVYCRVVWSPYWTKIFSASTEGDLSLWNLNDDGLRQYSVKKVASYKMHRSNIAEVLFLPLDGSIVTGSMDPQLLVQEGETGALVANLRGHTNGIRTVDYMKDSHALLSAGFDSEVFYWPLLSAGAAKPILLVDREEPHNHCIVSVKTMDDVPQALSLDSFGLLKVWDMRMMSCLQSFHLPRTARMIRDKVFHSMDSSKLSTSGSVLCFCPKNAYVAKTVAQLAGDPTESIIHLSMSPSTGSMMTGTQSGFQSWEVRSGVLSAVSPTTGGELTCCALELEGRKIVCCHQQGRISVYSTASGHPLCTFALDEAGDVLDIVACTSNRCIAVMTSGSVVGFSDTTGQSVTMEKMWRDQPPLTLAVSSDICAVFHQDGGITVYTLLTVMPAFQSSLLPDIRDPQCAAFCGKGVLACATGDGELAVFTVSTERRVSTVMFVNSFVLGAPVAASNASFSCMAAVEELVMVFVVDRSGCLSSISLRDPAQPMMLQRVAMTNGVPSMLLPMPSTGLLFVSTGHRSIVALSMGMLTSKPVGTFTLDGGQCSLPKEAEAEQLHLLEQLSTSAIGTAMDHVVRDKSGRRCNAGFGSTEAVQVRTAAVSSAILKSGVRLRQTMPRFQRPHALIASVQESEAKSQQVGRAVGQPLPAIDERGVAKQILLARLNDKNSPDELFAALREEQLASLRRDKDMPETDTTRSPRSNSDESDEGERMTETATLLNRPRDHARPLHHPLVDMHRRVLVENDMQRHPQRRLMTPMPVSSGVATRALTPQGWSRSIVQASMEDAKSEMPHLPSHLQSKHTRVR